MTKVNNLLTRIKEELEVQFSKNGKFTSEILTLILRIKNKKDHYSIVRKNMDGIAINKNSSAYHTLKNLLQENPQVLDELAIISDRAITYKEMFDEIEKLANFMHFELKCQKGENISICAAGSVEGIVSFFSMNKLGLVNARIFNGISEEKMKANIINFNSKTIMIDEKNLKRLIPIANQTTIENVVLTTQCDEKLIQEFQEKNPNIKIYTWYQALNIGASFNQKYTEGVSHDDTASILYTSGSSGEAKPISLSNKVYTSMVNIVCNTTNTKRCDGEKVVGVVSHEYPYAAINSTIMIILLGKTLIIPKQSNKGLEFNDLLSQKPDRIQAIPNFYKLLETTECLGMLATENLSNLNSVISGGEMYHINEKKKLLRFLKRIKSNPLLIDGFGFGELGSATALKFGLSEYFLLMNGIEAKALDPDTLRELPPDSEGILAFTGPTIAQGYYNNEEATKKSFVYDENNKKWFISDTYGSVHGKDKRLIKLGGRIREFFITSDKEGNFVKVYAGNIEDVLSSSGIVKDCIVVPSGDSATPEPIAYISLRNDCNLDQESIIDILKRKCESLEDFSRPAKYVFEEEISRTSAGKKDYTTYKIRAMSK